LLEEGAVLVCGAEMDLDATSELAGPDRRGQVTESLPRDPPLITSGIGF
jgi:hypothetical protein